MNEPGQGGDGTEYAKPEQLWAVQADADGTHNSWRVAALLGASAPPPLLFAAAVTAAVRNLLSAPSCAHSLARSLALKLAGTARR